MSHTIRLRGFWDVAREGGRAIHSRNFGKPRLPDSNERVWLTCSSLPAAAEVRLNGELILSTVAHGPIETEVTELLLARNVVTIAVPASESPGEVALQIRPAAS
jgi:hypothetical protein